MSLMSLNAWFVIVAILSYVVISKYNNRLAEVYLADQLACVLNTNSSCWDEYESINAPVQADWKRIIVNWQRDPVSDGSSDGRILQVRYTGVDENKRILKRLGGIVEGGIVEKGADIVFERLAHPKPLGIHNRGFRYLLNEGYETDEDEE